MLLFFSLLTIIISFLQHHFFFHLIKMGLQMRIACTTLIYEKIMKLNISNMSCGKTSSGKIINLVSSDIFRLEQGVPFIPFLITCPITIILTAIISVIFIGTSTLVGLGILIIIVLLQLASSKLFMNFRLKTTQETDKRIRLMNEAIGGIRVLKLYAWETKVAEHISLARKNELQQMRKTILLKGASRWLESCTVLIMVFVTFLTQVALNQPVYVSQIITVFALFTPLQLKVSVFFAFGIEFFSEIIVATNRIRDLLLLSQCTTYQIKYTKDKKDKKR